MSTSAKCLARITQGPRDLTIEDMLRLFEEAAGGDPKAVNVASEAFRLMSANPGAARRIIAGHPELAELEGVLDLIDRKTRSQARRVH